jgi:pyridoxal phosphate enzyme (YggS family)
MTDPAALRARLADVRERLARAAGRAGRDPATVRLVAISKSFTADHVRAAADCGQIDFGENKLQEALEKMDRTADLPIRWHLVGHLQSNKGRKAGAVFDMVHSVDQPSIAARLDEGASAAGRSIELLAQVDLAGEPSKHGTTPDQLPALLRSPGLRAARFVGLMLLPPAVDDPERARPFFRALRTLKDELAAQGVEPSAVAELSMGMSHDFEVAVEEGATLIRVGTAIFGSRAHV